jgi:hypothetical protein
MENRRSGQNSLAVDKRLLHHKVRRDAAEHALNVGRHRAVAAEQMMAVEHP